MAGSRILLVESDDSAAASIESPLAAAGHTTTRVGSGDEARVRAPEHELVVIAGLGNGPAAIDLCRALRQTSALSSVGILCIAPTDDVETRIAFLEAGADDVVARPFDDRELEARVEALLLRFQRARDLAQPTSGVIAPPRRIVAVFSPKGGAGTTTIAVNVALARALSAPDRVVVVDLDLQFGQVATFLDLTPVQTQADLARDDAALREAELLRTYGTRHDSGLHVIAAPGSPELAQLVTARHVDQMLGTILGTYDFVVVDGGSTFDERTMALLERADTVIFPVYLEIAALKALHTLVEYLNEAGSVASKATFVVNNLFAREILKLRDVETALGVKVAIELPYDPFVYLKAVNEGNPVVTAAPRSAAAERFRRLATLAFEPQLVAAAAEASATTAPSRNGRRPRFALRRR